MVTDKYGNKMRLGWNEYGLELLEVVKPFRTDEYRFPLFNERASTSYIGQYWRYRIDMWASVGIHGDPKGKDRVS